MVGMVVIRRRLDKAAKSVIDMNPSFSNLATCADRSSSRIHSKSIVRIGYVPNCMVFV